MGSFVLREDLPFNSQYATVEGHRMHYIDEGSGPVVILLHGNPTWCFYYRNLIRDLKDSFRVIAPDYIGCGLSEKDPKKHFRAKDRVRHIEELINLLSIDRYSLVMHDWGGSIGTLVAGKSANKVDRIVYLNTTLTETESLPEIIKRATTPLVGKYLTKFSKSFLKLTTSLGVAKKLPKNVKGGYFYPYRSSADRTAIWDFVADIPFDQSHPTYQQMLEMTELLPRLQVKPVQIVWGLKDPCFHREMLSKVAGHFPNAEVLELPDASHLVLEDAPERANAAIKSFLLGEAAVREATALMPEATVNALFEAFEKTAKAQPKEIASYEAFSLAGTPRYTISSFERLQTMVTQYRRAFSEYGLKPGDKALMLVNPGFEFLALSYAIMGQGAIPIYVDPGVGKEKLFKCIQDAKPDVFIGSAKAQLLRIFKGKKLFPDLKFSVAVADWFPGKAISTGQLKRFSSKPIAPLSASNIAMIAFTSGATGTPKGVIFSNDNIRSQLDILQKTFGLKAGKKDLPLLPIFSLFHAALGVTSVFAPLDPGRPLALNPEKITRLIDDLRIQTSFGSPTLWHKISEYCLRTKRTLDSLERVFMAGAPVSLEVLNRVNQIAPKGEAYTPYGSTEALPVTLVSSKEILAGERLGSKSGEKGVYVGKPVKGIQVKVIQRGSEAGKPLAQLKELGHHEIGELIVCGKNVSLQYLYRPDANKESKIQDGQRIWHRMGDVGYVDSEGGVYFCGRKAHVVEAEGRVLYPIPLEAVFNAHDKVRRSALISIRSGTKAAVAIEPKAEYYPQNEEEEAAFRQELLSLASNNPLTSLISDIFFHPSFPVDGRHNAKIFRDKLGQWADSQKRE